jgi:hypothetical protein
MGAIPIEMTTGPDGVSVKGVKNTRKKKINITNIQYYNETE